MLSNNNKCLRIIHWYDYVVCWVCCWVYLWQIPNQTPADHCLRERTLQGNTVSSNNNANTVSPVQQHSVGITGHTWSSPHSLLSTFSRCDNVWRSWDQDYDQTVNMQWSVDSVNFCVEKKVTENLCLVWMMTSWCFHYIKKGPLAFTEFDKQI